MSLDGYFSQLAFTPDKFQQQAFEILERNESVVVSAPTGAGKTLIAEAAVHLAVEGGGRAFYTTPIKALSNQKFVEFGEIYGTERVGLLTGDNSINGEAPVVVMTTEVLRNMIYSRSTALNNVANVILDEVHYLQDLIRGPVWEEIIIHAPSRIRLVCLSATIANAGELADWVRERRGATSLVVESERPVPLESLYFLKDLWAEDPLKLFPTFVRAGRPNPEVERLLRQRQGRRRRFVTPRRLDVVEHLGRADMLPAIYFIFSRAGCDGAAATVASAGLRLTDPDDRARLREIVDRRTAHLPARDLRALGFDRWVVQLESGIAAHHAGMVPAFKESVEEAFTAGLVKVVFATETLALGINMPARTVVLESMSKFNGETHELLQPGDYTQLTGRAGRRGIDDHGYGVTLYSPFVRFDRLASIAAAGAHPLRSSFRPTYNMAANLVANYEQPEAERLLESSFAQFQRRSAALAARDSIRGLRDQASRLRVQAACELGDVFEFLEASGGGGGHSAKGVLELESGDVIEHTGRRAGERVVVLQRDRWRSSDPRLVVIGSTGKAHRIRVRDLAPGTVRLGRIELPKPYRPKDQRFHHKVGRILKAFEPHVEEVLGWTIEERVGTRPIAACPDIAEHVRTAQKALRIEKDIERRTRRSDSGGSDLVEEFESILDLLDSLGYTEGWTLTESGEQLRVVYNELDLLLTESISAGALLGLDAPELAALASVFVYDPRGSGSGFRSPSRRFEERWKVIDHKWKALVSEEERRRLKPTRSPEAGYAETVHLWASGGTLEEVLDDEGVVAGDFVRNLRQVLDLLRQIRDGFPALADLARQAIRATDRGVVAAGGQE
jgi:ATP-dependent RNA helicase HelY